MMQPFSLKSIKETSLDILFPKTCVVCGKLDVVFCDRCKSKIIFMKAQNCPFCLKLSPAGSVCRTCRSKCDLTGVVVMAHYEEPLVSVIQSFKYEFIKILSDDLADLALPYFSDFGTGVVLTAVPSSAKRMKWRGYNQAEEIAEILARDAGVKYAPRLLKRTIYKAPQTQLNRRERFENVKNVFQVDKRADLRGKKVVILDDLTTSGATLDACAKQLRKLGAKQVWGFALARHR